ncbi:MAG: site-2 protease family protein [Gemmataceae bacterium]
MDKSTNPGSPDHISSNLPNSMEANGEGTSPPSVPPPPVSLSAWMSQNWIWFILFMVGIALAYKSYGMEGLLAGFFAMLGLGFVIFVHELGHFLAAKWCDVHVLTFSVGFGPAVPGCSFTRGETTYKLAMLPLGGYVNMVGEGPEADEEEDYPRSFKNKTVGQRMLIISAGVIMNVLLGALCFILVYRLVGVDRLPAVIFRTEPGSRAWEQGVHPGWKIRQIDDKENPYFDEMRVAVALSSANKPLEFVFEDQEGKRHERKIEPYRDPNNMVPVIGVSQPTRLSLLPEYYERKYSSPCLADSSSAYAREVELGPDDVILKSSDPKNPKEITDLPSGVAGWQELCKRMELLGDSPLSLLVAVQGNRNDVKKLEVSRKGFEFGDSIVGTTDPKNPDKPFQIKPLSADPFNSKNESKNPFEFRSRMHSLAGKPVVVQVARKGESKPIHLLVPPSFHKTLGIRMKMGRVASVRKGSSAEAAQLKAGPADGYVISRVAVQFDNEPPFTLEDSAMDPVRLPFELDRKIHLDGRDPNKWKVILTVRGIFNHNAQTEKTLPPLPWDDSYSLDGEAPMSPSSPMSIPQLGIAYWVESTVVMVAPGSPAEETGIQPGDVVQGIRFLEKDSSKPDKKTWSSWFSMASVRGKEKEVNDQWAHYFWIMQRGEYSGVQLKIKRLTGDQPQIIQFPSPVAGSEGGLRPVLDSSWPIDDRGFLFSPDMQRQKASNLVEACSLGTERTISFIQQMYMNLKGLFTGRISHKSVGGPIEIGAQAISAAREGVSYFVLLMGMISINLAVVNFLPIPVFDGGHMVFLIYEKLRGKPPSEAIRVAATYMGLFIIIGLMVFVFYLDISRRFLS